MKRRSLKMWKIVTGRLDSKLKGDMTHRWELLKTQSTVCFFDRWPQTKCKVIFDTSFWISFLCSFTCFFHASFTLVLLSITFSTIFFKQPKRIFEMGDYKATLEKRMMATIIYILKDIDSWLITPVLGSWNLLLFTEKCYAKNLLFIFCYCFRGGQIQNLIFKCL